ncbi:hypothetical protein BJ878DRAFT_480203 [Calycina marina]|uniref:Uncharacterized protein n=1 Tax=Calycina marina TaxID=1763456 RepID=A0A9P8CER3_9HELO|nr:hypothetical protein BJ878DRAFT_480203 [Calycina marina]
MDRRTLEGVPLGNKLEEETWLPNPLVVLSKICFVKYNAAMKFMFHAAKSHYSSVGPGRMLTELAGLVKEASTWKKAVKFRTHGGTIGDRGRSKSLRVGMCCCWDLCIHETNFTSRVVCLFSEDLGKETLYQTGFEEKTDVAAVDDGHILLKGEFTVIGLLKRMGLDSSAAYYQHQLRKDTCIGRVPEIAYEVIVARNFCSEKSVGILETDGSGLIVVIRTRHLSLKSFDAESSMYSLVRGRSRATVTRQHGDLDLKCSAKNWGVLDLEVLLSRLFLVTAWCWSSLELQIPIINNFKSPILPKT